MSHPKRNHSEQSEKARAKRKERTSEKREQRRNVVGWKVVDVFRPVEFVEHRISLRKITN